MHIHLLLDHNGQPVQVWSRETSEANNALKATLKELGLVTTETTATSTIFMAIHQDGRTDFWDSKTIRDQKLQFFCQPIYKLGRPVSFEKIPDGEIEQFISGISTFQWITVPGVYNVWRIQGHANLKIEDF